MARSYSHDDDSRGKSQKESETREDVARRIEDGYQLSSTMADVLGGTEEPDRLNIPAAVAANLELLVEWFWDWRKAYQGGGLGEALARWCSQNFGRIPEPSVKGMLHRAIRQRLSPEHRPPREDTSRLFRDAREERVWIAAVQSVGPMPRPTLERGVESLLEEVCQEAGVELGPGVRRMPKEGL